MQVDVSCVGVTDECCARAAESVGAKADLDTRADLSHTDSRGLVGIPVPTARRCGCPTGTPHHPERRPCLPASPVTFNMTVKQVDLYSATRFRIILEKLTAGVQGTVTFDAPIATAHNYTPGDVLKVTFESL